MGGGSGGGRGTGGTLKKGREERNSAARPGRSQRSRTERVGGTGEYMGRGVEQSYRKDIEER